MGPIQWLARKHAAGRPIFRCIASALSVLTAPEFQPSFEKYRQKSHGCDDRRCSFLGRSAGKKASTPKLDPYWQSAGAQQLLQAGQKLRYLNGRTLSDADRATLEWQQQLADYLNLIASWTQDPAKSEADFYHEKCVVYTSLLDLVPTGPLSDKILADYVDFVSNSSLYQQSPAEWFVEPRTLWTGLRPTPRSTPRCWLLSTIRAIPFWRWKWLWRVPSPATWSAGAK